MINKKDFTVMIKETEQFDSQREILIKKSRDVLKLSKQLINSAMRDENTNKLVADINKSKDVVDKIAKKSPKLLVQGSYKVAIQEYVEAILFDGFLRSGKMMTKKQLNVSTSHYIMGVADLTGELMRKAVIEATKGNYKLVVSIRNLINGIFSELSQFDFRENEIRRKFDSIKYDLKKIEDLILELKLKDRI